MDALVRHWPLFGLRLRSGDIELRLPRDEELAQLADRVGRDGVHDPGVMPFGVAWTDQPSPDLERGLLQYHWRQRAEWSPDRWNLELVVFANGEPVGCQAVGGESFRVRRVVGTGSWLLRPWQGRGIGRIMRTAVLALAFEGLGAARAESGAFIDNLASAAVSRALGYVDNGDAVHAPRGEAAVERRFVLDRDGWTARERPGVSIEGLSPCLGLFGVGT